MFRMWYVYQCNVLQLTWYICGWTIGPCMMWSVSTVNAYGTASDLWPLTSDQLLQTTLTPLHYAANFGRTDALRLLILEFGCDPNAIKDRVLKKCRIVWHVFEVCCHTRMCWPCTHIACTCCVHNYFRMDSVHVCMCHCYSCRAAWQHSSMPHRTAILTLWGCWPMNLSAALMQEEMWVTR